MDKPRKESDELEALAKLPDDSIDTSDQPEITDWSRAERGRFLRPGRQIVVADVDTEVATWFNADPQPEARLEQALREFAMRHRRPGEICPVSGLWSADGSPQSAVPIAEGQQMPPLNNAAFWTLIGKAA